MPTPATCSGNTPAHCCVYGGVVCPYLEENTIPNRRWVCGLMREHQDWDKVLADPRYKKTLTPLYEKFVWPFYSVKYNCKTWPVKGCECDGN